MVSIFQVYTTLKNLANKEQKGFITPDVFNSFATVAQNNIINDMFRELEGAKRKTTGGADLPRRTSTYQTAKEDLGRYVSIRNLYAQPINSYVQDSGVFFIPKDCRKIINIKTQSKAVVDLVYDVETMDHIVSSTLSAPTATFPAALVTDVIELSPASVNNVTITYYKHPAVEPQIIFDGNGDSPVNYNIKSIDFDLPEDYFSDVVAEIAKLLGVRLRDQNIKVFGDQESQKQ